ncbi:MAG: glucosaminidase domain-containing protein [Bacteroidales bacterium]
MIRKYTITIIFLFAMLIPGVLNGQQPAKRITVEEYIDRYKVIAVKKRLEHHIPASITLAQGILESGSGNSPLAVNAKNHFGIKCHVGWTGDTYHQDDDEKDECFRKYKSPEESFEDHSLFLTTRDRYSFLFHYDVTEYQRWAKGLKKAGYATNPNYAKLLINLIERYNLSQYDVMSLEEVMQATAYSDTQTKEKEKEKEKEDKNQEISFDEVKDPGEATVGTRELIVKRKNRIKYVIARKGDSPESLAEELDMWTWQIEKYNELNDKRMLVPGEIVYLQPKRRKGSQKHHTAEKGESMYHISQQYGIKLKHLYKKNNMEEGEQPRAGQKLWLRRKKPH